MYKYSGSLTFKIKTKRFGKQGGKRERENVTHL